MNHISERAERERRHFNEGLQRERYDGILSHTRYYHDEHQRTIRRNAFRHADGKAVLEIGAYAWFKWLEDEHVEPHSLDCINISEKELERGVALAANSRLQPRFHIMDAHQLLFDDEQFDFVFGGSILHHLDLAPALDEICRVLKPDGMAMFREPLDVNPVASIVRLLTPRARTPDERPFRIRDLREIERRFAVEYSYEQFMTVPVGILSRALFHEPNNFMNRAAFEIDRALVKLMPACGVLYRAVTIIGRKRTAAQNQVSQAVPPTDATRPGRRYGSP
jgi:SAM-dependent methyltransferase